MIPLGRGAVDKGGWEDEPPKEYRAPGFVPPSNHAIYNNNNNNNIVTKGHSLRRACLQPATNTQSSNNNTAGKGIKKQKTPEASQGHCVGTCGGKWLIFIAVVN